jgi:hypothetical protein
MVNPLQDSQRTTLPSAHLSEPLRRDQIKKGKRSRDEYCENANIKGSAAVWVDSICVDNENTVERRQAVTLMGRFYRHATRTITWIGPGIENGSRKIKLSGRTKKAIAFAFACLCAALLMQNPSGMSRTKTSGTELPGGVITANSSGPSRWSANAQEELLLESGDQKTLHNILVRALHDGSLPSLRQRLTSSLTEETCIFGRMHPHTVLPVQASSPPPPLCERGICISNHIPAIYKQNG